LALLTKARQARTEEKISTAALYYRSASRQASGTLKQKIDAELRGLKAAPMSQAGQTARSMK
jgi:hypothetical protein